MKIYEEKAILALVSIARQVHVIIQFILNQRWKSKIYKLDKVNDRMSILQQLDWGIKSKKKLRYESRKMVWNQAQD